MLDYLQSLGDQLVAEHQASAQIGHRGRKGTSRENILGRLLRTVLPSRFGIGGGEIRASNGARSGEHDLIIYDEPNCAFLFKDESVQVYPIETVYAVISVRSHLDAEHLRQFSDEVIQLRDTRQFPRSTPTALLQRSLALGRTEIQAHPSPAAFAFGYEGGELRGLSDALHNHYLASASRAEFPSDPILNCVCVMGRGIITQMVGPGEINSVYPFSFHPEGRGLHLTTIEHPRLAFALFITSLVYAVTEAQAFPPGLSYYTSAFTDIQPPLNLNVIGTSLPSS
jgi:hypothetical protein